MELRHRSKMLPKFWNAGFHIDTIEIWKMNQTLQHFWDKLNHPLKGLRSKTSGSFPPKGGFPEIRPASLTGVPVAIFKALKCYK